MVDVSEVEKKTELARTAAIEVTTVGSVVTQTVADMIKMADIYSRAGPGVPPHCRDKVGMCFVLIKQANDWGIPDLAVINKSYVVNNRGVERVAYESQLIHAVIERNARLKGRLRAEWTGEGDDRRCKIIGTFRGEDQPHEYESQPLGKKRDARGRNEDGVLKGSPLWDHDPDVQLFYSASRQWARLYCPDVILGAYTPEDAQYEMRDVTPAEPAVLSRLREAEAAKKGARGFDLERIKREAGRTTVIEGDATTEKADGRRVERPDDDNEGRADGDGGGETDAGDQAGRSGGGGVDQGVVAAPAGEQAAHKTKVPSSTAKPKPKPPDKRK